jgi:beta-glucosidase
MKQSFLFTVALCTVLCTGAKAGFSQQTEDNEARIESMIHKLTVEQKVDLLGGVSTWYTHAESSIGLPALRLSDGPAGLRSGIPATAYPAPIALAATWDTALAQKTGAALGKDGRVRGIDFLLGPGVNIARAPMGGRNFEYMGEDPWLASRIAVAYIQGVQSQGVSATVKHFMLNNQEFDRHNASSEADERTKREIYLPAFEAAVKEAHVGAIMDSYNRVDGVHSTQNGWMNNKLAKQEWGFDGVIMSDWDSVYDGVAAANNGLDLEMPFANFMSREALLPAIRDGRLSEAILDDKVRRILRVALRFGMLDRKQDDSHSLFSLESDHVALQVARESITLLKNEHSLLPLDPARTCTLAVVGPNASPAVMGGGGSAIVDTYKSVSELEGLSSFLAEQPRSPGCTHEVLYDSGWPANYDVFHASKFEAGLKQQSFASRDWTGASQDSQRLQLNEDRIETSKTGSLRWTGTFVAPHAGRYFVIVHDGRKADKHFVFTDGKPLPTDPADLHGELYYLPLQASLQKNEKVNLRFDYLPADKVVYPGFGILAEEDVLSSRAKAIAQQADAVIIAVGFDKTTEHEGADRTFGLPPLQDTMIRNIADLNPRVIVTLNAGGDVDMNGWIDRVPSLLDLWYGGQETGTATADVIFGKQNPEGHLPVSFESQWEDNPTHANYYAQSKDSDGVPHIGYNEGIFIGYRFYDTPAVNKLDTQPRFPFGFGLSYTTFHYGNFHIAPLDKGTSSTVTFTVTNTGAVDGSAVAQLYVGQNQASVPRPNRELKGFKKIFLRRGETSTISLPLDARSFAFWSTVKKCWKVDAGTYTISIGSDSRDISMTDTLRVSESEFLP